MQPLILDLTSILFLITIMVDHYPLFEFLSDSGFWPVHPVILQNVHHDNYNVCIKAIAILAV